MASGGRQPPGYRMSTGHSKLPGGYCPPLTVTLPLNGGSACSASHGWHCGRHKRRLKNGRLEEAQRLLCQPGAHGHKRSWELLQQVAQGFVERGERYLQHDNAVAAWNDLIAAEQMGAADSAAFRLRQTLTRLGLAEVRALLEAGEPGRAQELVSQLRH